MIDVTVKVDEARIAEFYAMYAEWMKADGAAEVVELEDWGPGDAAEAAHVWSKMSQPAKKLFKLLPQAPDSVAWHELALAIGPNAGADTVGGTFGWPARYAAEVGRTAPTKAKVDGNGAAYWLEPVVKKLFDEAASE